MPPARWMDYLGSVEVITHTDFNKPGSKNNNDVLKVYLYFC